MVQCENCGSSLGVRRYDTVGDSGARGPDVVLCSVCFDLTQPGPQRRAKLIGRYLRTHGGYDWVNAPPAVFKAASDLYDSRLRHLVPPMVNRAP